MMASSFRVGPATSNTEETTEPSKKGGQVEGNDMSVILLRQF